VGLLTIEAIQVPVFSRTTDATALLAALGGSTAGSFGAAAVARGQVVQVDMRMVRIAVALLVWVAITFAVEWWPFHFALDPSRVRGQAMLWSRSPFRLPSGVAAVLPGTLLAVGMGKLARSQFNPRFQRLQVVVLVGCATLAFIAAESGRLLLDGGRPTLVSVLLEVAALLIGLWIGSHRAAPMLRPDGAH
jgi:hypothetical protein